MKRITSNRHVLAVLATASCLFAASCSQKALVSGTVSDAPDSQVIVKQLDVNVYQVLDTIKTDASGAFRYSVPVQKGQPEFVYLFHGDTRIASLLLMQGDRVTVKADTLGHYSVEGSEECARLQMVESRYGDFLSNMTAAAISRDNQALSRTYIAHYRECIRYVMENPFSLTVIPVLYEKINESNPVFSQATDAIHFRNVCDSLKTVYPDSRYVKALEKETARREQIMAFQTKLNTASESGFPNITLPDVNGEKKSLADVRSRVILLHFWNEADATHKMFNRDVLAPLYEKYHDKGFEIYSDCVSPDKAAWAASVKGYGWINVNDGLGTSSPALSVYNVNMVPTSILIVDGAVTANVTDEGKLRAELAKVF